MVLVHHEGEEVHKKRGKQFIIQLREIRKYVPDSGNDGCSHFGLRVFDFGLGTELNGPYFSLTSQALKYMQVWQILGRMCVVSSKFRKAGPIKDLQLLPVAHENNLGKCEIGSCP